MNAKRVIKYVEKLEGIHFDEWLELQKCVDIMFKKKMEKLQAELNLTLVEKEGGGYGLPEENNEHIRT